MKKIMKKSNGITLISLVITIVILLILAGISISALTNYGLFEKAKEATLKTRASTVEEQVNIWKINKKTDSYIKENKTQTLQQFLDDLEGKKLITKDERNKIEINGNVTIGNTVVTFWKISDYIHIGDYINYSPQIDIKNYVVEGKYSGYTNTSKEILNQDIEQESFKWRVLNINDDGTVDLISDKPSNKSYYLYGALGYNNGVTILNNLCELLYSNSKYEAVARSINIEDIEKQMNDKAKADKESYLKWALGDIRTKKYDVQNSYYPCLYAEEKESGINNTSAGVEQSESVNVTERKFDCANESRFNCKSKILLSKL